LNDTGIRCRRGYDTRSFVLAGKACTWIHDRLQDVVLRTDLTDVGEVGTEGRAVSGHRVAGRTHSLAVEDSTTALYVACTQRRLQLFQCLQSRSLLLRYLLHQRLGALLRLGGKRIHDSLEIRERKHFKTLR